MGLGPASDSMSRRPAGPGPAHHKTPLQVEEMQYNCMLVSDDHERNVVNDNVALIRKNADLAATDQSTSRFLCSVIKP